jgi:AcrR family transcriptional regulator
MRKKTTGAREGIILIAKELFSKYGAKRVAVEEICRETRVSKVTFYKYFKNKADLVHQIKWELMEEGFKRFDEIKAMDIPYPEKIQLMTRWKSDFAARVNVDYIREMATLDDVWAEVKRRYLANIAEAQAQGHIRGDIDREFLWMVLEKIGELVKEDRWREVFDDLGQYQEQLRLLLYFGLLSRPEDSGSNS